MAAMFVYRRQGGISTDPASMKGNVCVFNLA